MQQEFHVLIREHKEVLNKAAKFQEDLKEADERVKRREASIYEAERSREHARVKRDRARDDLAKAQEAARELDRARLEVVPEWDFIKV